MSDENNSKYEDHDKHRQHLGLTALFSMISDGRLSIVTAIMNESTVPGCALGQLCLRSYGSTHRCRPQQNIRKFLFQRIASLFSGKTKTLSETDICNVHIKHFFRWMKPACIQLSVLRVVSMQDGSLPHSENNVPICHPDVHVQLPDRK